MGRLKVESSRDLNYFHVMNSLGKFSLCLLVIGFGACKDQKEVVDREVREAGYSMTQEGWIEAIRADHVAVVRKMAKTGFDVMAKDREGRTSLHLAAEAGSMQVADYLLSAGVAIDESDNTGITSLMLAAKAGRHEMVRWLLKQGADAKLKDQNGYMALMLAVTHHQVKCVEELAPYCREDLDSALLLAALVGEASAIDILTNYGASVHARMEDGRTPLMLAAENGHQEAVAILMDIGASRFATTDSGDTARSFAVSAGHHQIAEMIEKGFAGDVIALDTEHEIAVAMSDYVSKSAGESKPASGSDGLLTVASLEGARVSSTGNRATGDTRENFPILMRHYLQRELPLEVKSVSGNTATLRLSGNPSKEINVRSGDAIPNSNLLVVNVSTRVERGKLNNNEPIHIAVVEVEDRSSGARREWQSGAPVVGHDPVALVEDAVTGRRYLAKVGQKFTSEDGHEFMVIDVRPGQLVIEDVTRGEVSTLLLRGPRG
jgi:serine/threonine-protein phosphatase 6 regulatory ankyrin repeat subunit B